MAVPRPDQKIAFITGATSGIGKATAELFCKQGIAVVACGRRGERLEALKQAMATHAPVYPLVFDAREKDAIFTAVASLPEGWRRVDILINNAGNAHGLAGIQDYALDDIDFMVDLNIKGLLYVSKAVLPLMPRKQDAIIINVGSIAGKEAYPNGGVYCATKAAVDMLTRGMRFDLYKEGLRVACMHPGLVETEFSLVRFKGDGKRADGVYANARVLTADDCADALLYMATRPGHVSVHDMLLMPSDQAAARDLIRSPSKL
eukprot:TRINITY_DN924_c0_g1_i1.p1 TRINITY_DN924_c0_g1~~TRINITY_DN924_c0_g1_i1.p1  ORF type:complete len:281 (+),score=126.10 TRINITY_DN924_c0_g1_i1:62-844(+)